MTAQLGYYRDYKTGDVHHHSQALSPGCGPVVTPNPDVDSEPCDWFTASLAEVRLARAVSFAAGGEGDE